MNDTPLALEVAPLVELDMLPFARENNETILWILQRQAELRMELVNFYKKDFMEAHTALMELEPDMEKHTILMHEFVEQYRQWWESAFAMLDAE